MTIGHGIVALAIVWTLWYLMHVRRQVRSGAMIVPSFIAATLVFALCIVVVILTGVSPLHLVWLFPVSFLVGLVSLLFPLGTKLLLLFLGLLVGTLESSAQLRMRPSAGRGRRKSSASAGTPRRTRAPGRRGFR